MDPILYNYYIDFISKKKNTYRLLCLLHEMRIVSKNQLVRFFELGNLCNKHTVKQMLASLKKKQLIDNIRNSEGAYYFLTQEGYNYVGGYYSLPKVPEYNLNHHLQVNDYLIKMLEMTGTHPHLKFVLSERRQVYETKDFADRRNRKKYFVADFIFRFRTKQDYEVNWSFEIELTMKTRRRYREGIFPKYLAELKKREYARLIYVTPSPVIKEELDRFKGYFLKKVGEENEQLFNRLHVFSSNEFENEMKRLIKEDRFINW
ncbi:replication-relaxation family protein [Enterococcus sp. 5B3_DIV0040]|uniref:replication-relaxation family protein n=1 Tax=Enterococcus sp. 5B3_DIV0040 TaxID=1834182 RepID=UPI000A353603|nr:replication-relaxation family protein [Enterococcus sp. 5B3_DIV0040]OTO02248.1 hypothetical protein A5883_003075 [Enterococcus sp. 5B3_DIV0040]